VSFQTLAVKVVERLPVALWCGLDPGSPGSSCFLLDKEGVVFAPAVIYSGDAYQKYYGAVTGGSLPQQYISGSQFRSLSDMVEALQKKQGIRIQTISVSKDGDARLQFENGFTLVITMSANNGDVFERFELALLADPFTTHALSQFEYLDLRFGDKLYYKLKTQ
jgi:cell division septal protein FtsQ